MDAALVIDPELVTDALSNLALNTLNAYQNGANVKWHDAELAVYVVFIFGEINKSRSLGRIRLSIVYLAELLQVAEKVEQHSAKHQW